MTTNGTAAAWRSTLSVPFAVTAFIFTLALGGCANDASNLLGSATQPLAQAPEAATAKTTTVAIAPVLGVPDGTSKQIISQLSTGLDSKRFTLVTDATQPADYTLRGYATAAKDPGSKDKSASKLSYFFDVMDRSGKKVNRIAGDEMLGTAGAGKDIWHSVTPGVTQSVASKTATAFSSFVPAAGGAAMPAMASAADAGATPIKTAAGPADLAPKPTQTGSIEKSGQVLAMVPSVTGAPGDGSAALSAALQKELVGSGISMTDSTAAQAYRVEGKVTIGADKGGKQPIEISWVVKDPQGKKLGTVSQKNEIPQGSLDGAWGKTADAAAAAAAQGIVKLIPGAKVQ